MAGSSTPSPDEASLLALKSSVDPSGVLPWRRGSSAGGVCSWYGVRQCSPKGRVTKLVLESVNLTGNLHAGLLSPLDELRYSASRPSLSGVRLLLLRRQSEPLRGATQEALQGHPQRPHLLPPLVPSSSSSSSYTTPSSEDGKKRKKRIAVIVSGSAAAFLFLAACVPLAAAFFLSSRRRRRSTPAAAEGGGGIRGEDAAGPSRGPTPAAAAALAGEEGVLMGSGEVGEADVLRRWRRRLQPGGAAEGVGRDAGEGDSGEHVQGGNGVGAGRDGKASQGSRQRRRGPRRRRVPARGEALGAIRHPNLVPLRAYFQAQQERLLVYDYFPNGSLLSLLHGSSSATGRGGGGKPLHWTSCLKIAEDVAAGLQHLHEAAGVVHGNVKPSNVLLGSDFECCLTDYSLAAFVTSPDSGGGGGGGPSLVYRAPECRQLPRGAGGGSRRSRTCTGSGAGAGATHGEGALPGPAPPAEEKLAALVSVAAACVSTRPEERPAAGEALRMIREARAAASSNGSDQSPGRWSDAVQSLPRSYGLDHMSLTERD
ncbi:unnamed protein product [Spirodela intermedia]|uniref:Protein kinase domain-containing protein n=1 Tax=Spirodela intermedia TaxID=51605 RepID=A0A7I8J8U7_SPIIN|nr:unnamed protein product [Spirodela intermedia]CAA6666636.1 unnamed protein product [Spirodela intermedia]